VSALLRRLGTYAGLGAVWVVHFLPAPWIRALGAGLGSLLYRFGRGRVTDVNLRLCFPEMTEAGRKALARAHFRALGRASLELSVLWFGSDARVLGMVRIKGREHLDALAGKVPVIMFAPHFVALNAGGARIAHTYPDSASIYSRQKNPVVDHLFLKGRLRFGRPKLISRQEGMRPILRAIRERLPFYFLPDMDFGPRDAVFSPFFAATAATVTAMPRLAKLAGAKIVPVVSRMVPEGYEVECYPAWENYPTGDLEADVRRMNAFIEDRVREMPEQYFWAHKRFKTRPPGEPSPYRPAGRG
jgi:Kdo2-lipid IVA lauroyltransferase/acyltransferase